MAYDNNETRVITDIEKGSRGDVIRISEVKNKSTGSISCDIRMYYDNEGELAPTKKGVRFNTECMSDVVGALIEMMTVDELEDLATLVADKLCDEGADEGPKDKEPEAE